MSRLSFLSRLNVFSASRRASAAKFQSRRTSRRLFLESLERREVFTADIQIIDDGDAGFGYTGDWISYGGQGYENDVTYAAAGAGSGGAPTAVANWTASVTPGEYRVAATWSPLYNRATDAPFTVLDGSTSLGTTRVNQELAPADFTDQSVGWTSLGTFTVTGNTLVVQLGNNADEFVIADAVRIERIVPPVQIIDDGDAGFGTLGTWIPYGGQGYENDVTYAAAGTGSGGEPTAVASWTATVEPGTYRVAATWSPESNRATDAPYTVLDGTTNLGTTRVNQELAPADFTAAGVGWQTLGTYTVVGNSLVVQLGNNANEFIIADAIRLERVTTSLLAANDTYTAAEDTPLTITAAGILANDTGSGLSAALVTGPASGTLSLSANGGFTFAPSANYSGTASFTVGSSRVDLQACKLEYSIVSPK